MNRYKGVFIFFHGFLKLQGDSVAKGPKLLSINSLGPLATESPCTICCLSSQVLNIAETWLVVRIREVWVSNTGYENDGVRFCLGFAQIPSQKIQRQYVNPIHDSSKHSEYPSWHTFMDFVMSFLVLCGFRKRQNIAQCGLRASQARRTSHTHARTRTPTHTHTNSVTPQPHAASQSFLRS